jgi:hypothetical protein
VIADFAAERTGQPADSLLPSAVAWAMLGVAIAAYEQWLEQPSADLGDLLDTAMRTLAGAYSGRVGAAPEAAAP